MTDKTYLGDAVYARVSAFGEIILTTSNGIVDTNIIILGPGIIRNLLRYIDDMGQGICTKCHRFLPIMEGICSDCK